jgi:hypothetical protein
MIHSEPELREEISKTDERLARTERIAADLDESDRPFTGTYHFRAMRHETRAVLSLLIGEVAEARTHLRKMATAEFDYVSEVATYPEETAGSGDHKVQPSDARSGLSAALLANNEQLIQRGIDACRNLPESYPKEHEPVELYWRARALAEVVAESDAVDDRLAQYDSARYDVVDDGWIDVLHGLHETDAERVTVGLHTLLGEWAEETEPDVTDAETLLDVDTAALYVLARRRGLNVEIDHERFPEQIDDLVSV